MFAEAIKKTDAKIVISSSWRNTPEHLNHVKEALRSVGIFDRYIGVIQNFSDFKYSTSHRAREIKTYLEGKEITKYAILDDDWLADTRDYGVFFNTQEHIGITQELCDKLVEYFR